jgi:LysM repeat protein
MAYTMYLGGVLMPITPSKVKVKINNQNDTLTLINGEEINILKEPGLTDVSFDLLLPQVSYPFTNGGAQSADYYLSLFERLKTSKQPFQFILNRSMPSGRRLFYTNLTVGMEDYQITDDAEEGFDITVTVSLKQYRHYGTKTVKVQPAPAPAETPTATVEQPQRETSQAPQQTTYTVKSGDCLWNIAKKYLGDGSRYNEIYNLNKDKITNPNLIYAGQVLTLPS